jgi:hypothetical protein
LEKWEYRFENVDLEFGTFYEPAQSNQLGEQGWELVGVINETKGGARGSEIRTTVILIFKRRKP